jgi:hypothetical protein
VKKVALLTVVLLLSGNASAQNALSNIVGNIRYIVESSQLATPAARVPGAYVTLRTDLQNGTEVTSVAYDPRLQRKLVRNPLDPRHPTAANDALTYALGQGTLYNNQPQPPAPPKPEPAPAPAPPAPIVPLAVSSANPQQ